MHLKSLEIVGTRRDACQANQLGACAVMGLPTGDSDAV
jgi:hypothetical protein